MARYDWPDSPTMAKQDRLALRNGHYDRLWSNIAAGYLESAGSAFRDALARLAEAGLSEAEIERRRWVPIGPSAVLNGQAYAKPRVAGRIRDLKRSPDGQRIYAASAFGGVWFSGDGGESWAPLGGMATTPDRDARGRAANSLITGCLHVEFGANADADVVYAGTGEPNTEYINSGRPGEHFGGIGILKLVRKVGEAIADPTGNPWDREAPNLTGAGIFRIVRDPTDANTLVAATTLGLFFRTGAFTSNADWTRVPVAPFNNQPLDMVLATDAVWVPLATAPAAAPSRLFVAAVNIGSTNVKSAVYVSEHGTAGPFERIDLPAYDAGNRIALTAVLPLAAAPANHPQIAYALAGAGLGKSRLWRIDAKTARAVANVPPTLFGGTRTVAGKNRKSQDQSWYDMAIAVNPSNPQLLFLGGSAELFNDGWNASFYRCTVSGTAAANNFALDYRPANNAFPSNDGTFSGQGVHADVHSIRVSEDGLHVWIGCDGGVFASRGGGMPFSFEARNTGLAVLQCGYVASNPRDAGAVFVGTQDNGTLRRIGDTVWEYQDWARGGDGGGVVYHPGAGREAFMAAQGIHARWKGNQRFGPPVFRENFKEEDFEYEDDHAAFYSSGAAVEGASVGKARLAIGTFRVWLTDDWDPLAPAGSPPMSWRTVPTATDPLARGERNFDRDRFTDRAGFIVAVRWLNRGTLNGSAFRNSKLLVLYQRAIALIYQEEGVDRWNRKIIAYNKKKRITKNEDIPPDGGPSEKLPSIGAWSDIAVHRATKAGDPDFKGSFYVSTTSLAVRENTGLVEYDRMDTLWWFDGKDKFWPTGLRNKGIKAPAFAVLCDPENPDIVYVGTAMGVWKGTFDAAAATPTWSWEIFSIGLPEAIVQDLSIHWDAAAPNGGLKLLRAALESRGVWEVDISQNADSIGKSFLRVHNLDTRRIAPTRLTNLTETTANPPPYPRFFSPDIALFALVPPAWAGGNPTEADLATAALTAAAAGQSFIGPIGAQHAVKRVGNFPYNAFVQVHHRHTRPIPPAEVKVLLLKRRIADADGDGGGIALSPAWKAAVIKVLVNGQNATLDNSWKRANQAETTNPATNAVTVANSVRNPSGPVDARLPRSAAFTVDLSGALPAQRYLLLAVLTTSKDPLTAADLAGATVADVVLNSRHVCAKLVST